MYELEADADVPRRSSTSSSNTSEISIAAGISADDTFPCLLRLRCIFPGASPFFNLGGTMRFTRFLRASAVGAALSILLGLGTVVAAANNGRDFNGFFDVSDVQKQGELVQVTLHLQLFNTGIDDAKSVVITLVDSTPSMTLLGSFTPVKVWKHQQRINLTQQFSVTQREYAEWMNGPGQPNLIILFEDAKGNTWHRGAQVTRRPIP
jgi:hypothetical protein